MTENEKMDAVGIIICIMAGSAIGIVIGNIGEKLLIKLRDKLRK